MYNGYIPGIGFSVPGEKGDQGDAGPAGATGATGATGAAGAAGQNGYGVRTADGRLTTVSSTPILTSNQLAKTTLYYTPFTGNQIALYSGGSWSVLTFAETSLSLSGYTASRNYDIWGYNNSGTLALESTIWTNDTTRATALTTQDGVYCKTGDTTRRYLGTVRINSTGGQIDWSIGGSGSGGVEAKATVWNESNRVLQSFTVRDAAASWTHAANNTWASLNASTANRFSFINGRSLDYIEADLYVRASCASGGVGSVAFGLDSTSSPASSQLFVPVSGATTPILLGISAIYKNVVAEGQHYLQALDYSLSAISTFYGAQSPYTQSGFIVKGWF